MPVANWRAKRPSRPAPGPAGRCAAVPARRGQSRALYGRAAGRARAGIATDSTCVSCGSVRKERGRAFIALGSRAWMTGRRRARNTAWPGESHIQRNQSPRAGETVCGRPGRGRRGIGGALQSLAKSYVRGDGQHQDGTFARHEGKPDVVVELYHNLFFTPQNPLLL